MSAVTWTITHPSGTGTGTLAELGVSSAAIDFRAYGVSTATLIVHRDILSEADWWETDSSVTIFRNGQPFYTGRVQESPNRATSSSETRLLSLADAWQDLEEVIYQEPWGLNSGSVLYPRAILGVKSDGEYITTGQQITEAIAYAISQGVSLQIGTIETGFQLWPSEVTNVSCAAVIQEQLRFHPDWQVWIDHSTSPPTFNAMPKSAMSAAVIDVNEEIISDFNYAEVVRNVPRGVRIVYESASSVGDSVYRSTYIDSAGDTTGRKVMQAVLQLEGMNMNFQKVRIQTRTLPTDGPSMVAYFKKKWPELQEIPDAAFSFSNVQFALVAEEEHAPAVNPIALRIAVEEATELPRELLKGSIEDWMRVKVGKVNVKYSLKIIGTPNEAQRKILDQFVGSDRSFTITATNAETKLYKGLSSYSAGEGRPVGLAAAIFAAATEPQYEGSVSLAYDELPATNYHGTKLQLKLGDDTLFSGALVHSVSVDIFNGTNTVSFGPAPYLTAGDFLELQRLFRRRQAKWMSPAERTSNELGAEAKPGSNGDIVTGYDQPETIVPPAGGDSVEKAWKLTAATNEGAHTFRVSSRHSSITLGLNGDMISLSSAGLDTDTSISSTKHIVLQADVDSGLTPSNWAIAAVDAADTKMIVTSGDPLAQTKLRLHIGTIKIEGGKAYSKQGCDESQVVLHDMLNGKIVLALHPYPTHPSAL